jgi:hypothetical protein
MSYPQAGQGLGALADPDPLPPAPFLERFLLQDPIPTVIFLVIAAAIGWWLLQRAGKPRAAAVTGVACLLGAGGVYLLARLVVTEREALVARCAELVNNTIAMRSEAVEPLLRSDVIASVPQLNGEYNRAEIVKQIRENIPLRRGAKEANFKWATATLDGPNVARTQCRVQVQMPLYEAWMPTTWMIHWTRTDANAPWQVRRIEAQQFGFGPNR